MLRFTATRTGSARLTLFTVTRTGSVRLNLFTATKIGSARPRLKFTATKTGNARLKPRTDQCSVPYPTELLSSSRNLLRTFAFFYEFSDTLYTFALDSWVPLDLPTTVIPCVSPTFRVNVWSACNKFPQCDNLDAR